MLERNVKSQHTSLYNSPARGRKEKHIPDPNWWPISTLYYEDRWLVILSKILSNHRRRNSFSFKCQISISHLHFLPSTNFHLSKKIYFIWLISMKSWCQSLRLPMPPEHKLKSKISASLQTKSTHRLLFLHALYDRNICCIKWQSSNITETDCNVMHWTSVDNLGPSSRLCFDLMWITHMTAINLWSRFFLGVLVGKEMERHRH